jgi:hypothetical protein
MKKYKLSEGNINEFWELFFKKKKTPYEIQKIVDNDPILKKLQADYDKIDASTGPILHNIKSRNPEIYDKLAKIGLVPKNI